MRDLSVSKDKAGLLASRLQERNLLGSDVRICRYRIWNNVLKTFFKVDGHMAFCHDIHGVFSRLTCNDPYMGRTAPLTSKRCILYICSTKTGTEYFKHALYSPFFPLQNAVSFIMLTCLVPVLFTFFIHDVLKLKKIIPAPKG